MGHKCLLTNYVINTFRPNLLTGKPCHKFLEKAEPTTLLLLTLLLAAGLAAALAARLAAAAAALGLATSLLLGLALATGTAGRGTAGHLYLIQRLFLRAKG